MKTIAELRQELRGIEHEIAAFKFVDENSMGRLQLLRRRADEVWSRIEARR